MDTLTAESAWSECLEIIQDNISYQKYKSWFEPINPVKLENDTLTIQVPSQFWYEWLEEHYYNMLRSTIAKVLGREGKLEYSVLVEKSDRMEDNRSVMLPQRPSPPNNPQQVNTFSDYHPGKIENPFVIPGIKKANIESNLNSNYVFERYIEGDCNRLARSAAMAISENPGKNSFNPLFVYGGTGLGKTHLIQSIGNKIKQDFGDDFAVMYVSSETFTNEFVQAIRNNRASEFTTFYRNIDVLIVDDIQFFSGKEKTQEEFFHIFNALHQDGKQIILSSDRAPKDIPDIEDRLISRFSWGLSADLQIPEYETRFAILERKANDNGITLDPNILEFIAHNFKSNVRDLEGAIIKLLATASLKHVDEIDLTLAKNVLKDMVKSSHTQISIESIQNYVCEHFGIDTNKVREKTRKQEIVEARQIAMFLSKKYTKSSLKTIGLQFGGRDHSTVIHAISTVEERLSTSPKHKRIISELEQKIEVASL
ncbi:chromosomal replication initiator protein DnaA [Rhodohalobacter barkolensis]|uniref:Chromosomal replication initiator protein DnaA n=1 Tax=Rhodohalobacter barkolensis TaxID=2053187 RepID=A0A2N0VEC6_9BACT|nr:chromosomal replication initiator protein DnaA [Rhodohalobacter barkolensis]PKD42546.1 chromosomal replication initiator protein DnaA [Rhodohalobacter barkolensis]